MKFQFYGRFHENQLFLLYTPYNSKQVSVFLLVLEDQEELDDEIWRGLQHCHSVQNMSWKSSTKSTLSCLNSSSSSIFDYLKWYSTYPSSNVFLKQELEKEPNMVSPASRTARNTFNFEFGKSPLSKFGYA